MKFLSSFFSLNILENNDSPLRGFSFLNVEMYFDRQGEKRRSIDTSIGSNE